MKRTVIFVELVVYGDTEHAHEVVEAMLDNGAIQDPINSCAADNDCGRLKVLSARQVTPTRAQADIGLAASIDVYPSDAEIFSDDGDRGGQ